MAVPLFFLVGVASAGASGLLWGLLCVFMTSGLSVLYLYFLARSGKVSDPRRIPQAERVRPLRAVAALHAGTFLTATLLETPATLRAVLLSYAIATALFALLSPVTNLSLHAAGVSGVAVCLLFVFGPWGAPALVLVPLVWWARAMLGRHTSFELAGGVLVGAGSTRLAFELIGRSAG